jgi:hypothetical protein
MPLKVRSGAFAALLKFDCRICERMLRQQTLGRATAAKSAERTFVAFGENLPTPSQISCLFWKVIPVLQFIAYPSRTVARANIGLIDRQSEQGAAAAER